MQNTLKFKMVTPVQTVFEQSVEGVSLPTRLGEITVLPEHTELVSILEPGELTVRADGKSYPLAVSGGLVEVYGNTLYVLADAAEHAHEIDLAAAEQRTRQLEQDLQAKANLDINSYALLQKQLEHERARLQVGKKWKK